ncbi:hypothetical protein PHYC_03766 [Phycisphaerales bacterium]|nr:hypothetical protein PHYC_03766 [Phycisphaerales bacterium]
MAVSYTCPRCGRRFSRRPVEHTCASFSLGDHFSGSAPHVRRIFNRLFKSVKSGGRVQVTPLKSMIAFNAPKLMGGAAA